MNSRKPGASCGSYAHSCCGTIHQVNFRAVLPIGKGQVGLSAHVCRFARMCVCLYVWLAAVSLSLSLSQDLHLAWALSSLAGAWLAFVVVHAVFPLQDKTPRRVGDVPAEPSSRVLWHPPTQIHTNIHTNVYTHTFSKVWEGTVRVGGSSGNCM